MVIGGGKYMADCLSDFGATFSTSSNEVEAPQTLDSAELNERFMQPLRSKRYPWNKSFSTCSFMAPSAPSGFV